MTRSTLIFTGLLLPLALGCGDKDPDCDSGDSGDGCGSVADDSGAGADDSGDGGVVELATAPDATMSSEVHGEAGFLYTFEPTLDHRSSNNLSSGVLMMSNQMEDGTYLSVTIWDDPRAGGSWEVVPGEDEPTPGTAVVALIEPTGHAGSAVSGTVTIDAWRPTDSPQIFLVDGTFTGAGITNENDPSWVRSIRGGSFTWLRVTSATF